jgi:hypothetical protein
MSDTKNPTESNQEEDEIQQSRRWNGKAMNGTWDGTGTWHLADKTWSGHGKWQGGLISGTWNAKGKWKPSGNDAGDWNCEGELHCTMDFLKYMEHYIIIVGSILTLVISTLLHFVGNIANSTTILIAALVVALTVLGVWIKRSTTNGKVSLGGTWKDVGEFRILDLDGKWRLGYHTGVLSGKMKDPKPR